MLLLAAQDTGVSPSADDYLRVIRAGDVKALEEMSRRGGPQVTDRQQWTPLHYAALYGSAEAVRVLLNAGADPNARNLAEATPLLFAAYSFEKTRLLVEKGADVNAACKNGYTAILVAAGVQGNERTVRYLLEKGADAKKVRPSGGDLLMRAAAHQDGDLIRTLLDKGLDPHRAMLSGDTALTESVLPGEHRNTRILLEAGADPNATTTDAGKVKNGPIDSFGVTPLALAAQLDEPSQVAALIKAGAKLDATDHRHMTPLMMAVATDRANPANVRLLIDAGADLSIADRYGETALDWAMKYRNPEVLAALEKAGAKGKGLPPAPRKPAAYKPDAREAVTRAAALLAKSNGEFFPAGGGCVGCHHQPFAGRAFAAMKEAGLPVQPELRQILLDGMVSERAFNANTLPLVVAGGGKIDSFLYPVAAMADLGEPSSQFIDLIMHYTAETQDPSGAWHEQFARPPLQESSVTRTMLAIKALKTYGWPARREEFDARIAKARAWLATAQTWSTLDEADRIMGLSLAGADPADLRKFEEKLVGEQRPDGGWAQTRYLDSDAFGTAAVLYSLRKAGLLNVSDAAYQRGVRFLLDTQFPDGSWYVRSRAVKLQPYFPSAFPFDHDQWISNSATAYAVIALAPAAGVEPRLAQR